MPRTQSRPQGPNPRWWQVFDSRRTYAYDFNGNLVSTGGSASSSFSWDYRNRITQTAATTSATTTYSYDQAGQRVRKVVGSATTSTYVNKFYEVTQVAGTTTATTTAYIWAGDMLVAFVEGNGTATSTRFVHPDHLGSTNVVTDSAGAVVGALDYYPYGTERINTGGVETARQFVGQYFDGETSLNYLNARYLANARGQFISQDPVFRNLGVDSRTREALEDPQLLHAYAYGRNNPIRYLDRQGRWYREFITGQQSWSSFHAELGEAAYQLGQDSAAWNFAFNHPYTTGALTAVGSIPAVMSGGSAAAAFQLATYPGVGAAFAAQHTFAALVYSAVAANSTLRIPGIINQFAQADPRRPSSYYPAAWSLTTHVGPSVVGGHVGAISDIYQFVDMLYRTLGTGVGNIYSSSIQTRREAANIFNTGLASGSSGGSSGGGTPSNESIWVTPSGAIVTWGGQLVSGPINN